MKASCERCERTFEYEGKRPRRVCDRCRRAKWARYQKRYLLKEGETDGRAWQKQELGLPRFGELAAQLGVSEATLHHAERRALEKLRRHPELAQLWGEWKEAGGPIANSGLGLAEPPSAEEAAVELLERQLEVVEWYSLHAAMVENLCSREAIECLKEINKCQRAIKRAMEQVMRD